MGLPLRKELAAGDDECLAVDEAGLLRGQEHERGCQLCHLFPLPNTMMPDPAPGSSAHCAYLRCSIDSRYIGAVAHTRPRSLCKEGTCPLTFVVASLIANLLYDIYQVGHALVINHADALIEPGAYFPVVFVGSLVKILVSDRNRDVGCDAPFFNQW